MKLDPETEIVATLGSKEGFANMAQAITAPGDVMLVPNPTYPIHAFRLHHRRGGDPAHLPASSTATISCAASSRRCSTRSPSRLLMVLRIRPIRPPSVVEPRLLHGGGRASPRSSS